MMKLQIHSTKKEKMNGYFEETNENKYLILFPTNDSREKT